MFCYILYIPFVFYLKRKDWKWRKVRISEGALSGQLFYPWRAEEVYGSLEFNHLRFRPLFRLPVALKLTPTLSGNASSHSFAPTILNLLTIVLVLSSCARYVNIPNTELDMFLDMFKWLSFQENCMRSRRRKTWFYELSRHKRVEEFVRNWNSIAGISRHLSLSLSKRDKKKEGIPKHFYASTCTRESRIPRSKDKPLHTHFVKTLTTEFQFLSSLYFFYHPSNNRVAPKIYTFVQCIIYFIDILILWYNNNTNVLITNFIVCILYIFVYSNFP